MKNKFLLSFLISMIAFTLILIGFNKAPDKKPSLTPLEVEAKDTSEDLEEVPPEQKVKDEILFLLLGVDAQDVKESKGTRTDTMMLFKVNFDTGAIRDTRVLINGRKDKINHAHSNGGVKLTMETVKEFLNLDLNYYVKVDYQVVKDLVDAIGGVEIDVPQKMEYIEYDPSVPPLNINIKKGLQVLDGKNAHDFLRWRTNNNMTRGYTMGDIGRIQAQQYFMKELIKQTLKPKNIIKLPKIVDAYFENVETNIPMSVMAKGALSAKKIDVENMNTATIPGEFLNLETGSYWQYYNNETKTMVEEMFGEYLRD